MGSKTKTQKLEAKEECPEVTRRGILDMQVCVPEDWSNKEVVAFANAENPCGVANGWCIRKEGSRFLDGAPERVQCNDRKGYVHIMLDC